MAENILKTRIMLKYDSIANWNSSSLILKKGEIAIAEIPSETSASGLTPPAIGIKVGDGEKAFTALPWIQAIAGDVSAWAKAAQKPTYQASEIINLSDYISSEIQDTNTQYQIVKSGNIYKLQKKDIGDSAYSDVANSTIDLTDIITRLGNVEQDISDLDVSGQINTAIGNLKYTDTAVDHKFVTKVSEANGIIAVERAALTADDIPSLTMAKISDLSTALAGKQDTVAFEGAYDKTSNKAATMADVTSAVSGLSGAMHFKGVVTAIPPTSGTYASGDVVIKGNKEYVYDGTNWHELGDEAVYAVKGSIVNADIAANAAIDKSKIAGLGTMASETAANYVTKTEATGYDDILTATNAEATYVTKNGTDRLMTADEGTKLAGIAANAQVNVLEGIKVGTSNATITNKIAQLGVMAGKANVAEADLATDLATKINSKTNDVDLAAIAKSGEVKDLKQTDNTILVFNCGNSTTVI